MPPVIEIDGLTKAFDGIVAVDNIRLTVDEGEMFGVVGPDGAGKTTTMRLLCGLLTPTAGTAKILGNDLVRESKMINREIGYMSQRVSLYGDLTVNENIEFFAEINEVYDFKRRRDELLEFTRLTPSRDRRAEQLSGGMKQKLGLACTLIHHPRVLFLDEPTTGVDPVSRRDFWHILSSLLEERITIVMTTPYLDEAERCSRVALMHQGKVMVADEPQRLKRLMHGEVIEVICNRIREAASLLKERAGAACPGLTGVQVFGDRLNLVVTESRTSFPSIERLLRNNGITVAEWRIITPSLENVFISLVSAASPGNATSSERQ